MRADGRESEERRRMGAAKKFCRTHERRECEESKEEREIRGRERERERERKREKGRRVIDLEHT